jgi:hypothetical protein
MSFKRKNLHFWALYTVIFKFSFLDVFTFLSNTWLTHGVTWWISLLMYDYCCVRSCYGLWMRTCILRSDWLQWGPSRSSIMASKSVFSQLMSASICIDVLLHVLPGVRWRCVIHRQLPTTDHDPINFHSSLVVNWQINLRVVVI